MGDRIDPADVLADEGARTADWLGGLLVRGLSLPEGLSVDQRDREFAGARTAVSGLAGEVWDTGGPGIAERIQAAQFVSAHAAAMDWQAEANRRDLPPHARATSQRLARQLMALTTSQIHALCRLKAERRREREATARQAEHETDRRIKARAADTRAMIAGFEQTLAEVARADRAAPKAARDGGLEGELDGDLNGDFADDFDGDSEGALERDFADGPGEAFGGVFGGAAPSGPPAAGPRPLGAGVPDRPDDPAPLLNRRQRRALARLRRKRVGADR
jgi:hypothetical protein